MSKLFRNAKVGENYEIYGKSVECIHIEYETRNTAPYGYFPHYTEEKSRVTFAYTNSFGDLKTIELRG